MKPVSEWTTEEINTYLHEKVMGRCWFGGVGVCPNYWKHGEEAAKAGVTEIDEWCGQPDYCSSDSPRRLLEEVVAKVAIVRQNSRFYREVMGEAETVLKKQASGDWVITAYRLPTAEQIARAAVSAHAEAVLEAVGLRQEA